MSLYMSYRTGAFLLHLALKKLCLFALTPVHSFAPRCTVAGGKDDATENAGTAVDTKGNALFTGTFQSFQVTFGSFPNVQFLRNRAGVSVLDNFAPTSGDVFVAKVCARSMPHTSEESTWLGRIVSSHGFLNTRLLRHRRRGWDAQRHESRHPFAYTQLFNSRTFLAGEQQRRSAMGRSVRESGPWR